MDDPPHRGTTRDAVTRLPAQPLALQQTFHRFPRDSMSDTDLKATATAIRDKAYAPYSNFKVGAAIRGASGRVYPGVNVENVAYPEGTCAEAGAIAAMVAGGETELTEVYVIADSPAPVPPCGGCRQKLAEFGKGDTPVTLATMAGEEVTTTIADLLPGAFTMAHMEKG